MPPSMPLDSGERTGVKQSLRPKAVAVSSVSLAMYAEIRDTRSFENYQVT